MTGAGGYIVYPVDSPAGAAALAARKISPADLSRAIELYRRTEQVRIGTLIGINDDGVFFSPREGWRPDLPDAFAEPLGNIPWVHVLELLGRVPEGTTGRMLESDSLPQELGVRWLRITDEAHRAIRAAAAGEFRETAQRQVDGTWLVPVAADTYDAIEARRLPGESHSDTILRSVAAKN